MYLIQYELIVGDNRHYAPSAGAAVRLIKEIEAGGGRLRSITRTRDVAMLTFAELSLAAELEIGPFEAQQPLTLSGRLKRLFGKGRP